MEKRELSVTVIKKITKKLFYKRKGKTKIYKFLGIPVLKIIKINNQKEYKLFGMSLFYKENYSNRRQRKFFGINIYSKPKSITADDFIKYTQWLEDVKNNKTLFIPITKEPYKRKDNDIKIFAYYLSQFHCIPENNEAHGKGFTEWSNTASSVPAFIKHYQPKIPYDLGFYNLLMPGVIERQVEIAKMYGIYGFCFYYYWFNGKKVLEKPLEYFLNSKIDFHFHFFWANETWSSRWQGGNKEIILEQKYDEEKFEQFFYDLLPFIKDSRYEKINNRPILMIYYPEDIGKDLFNKFSDILNKLAKKNGFDGMYLTTIFDFRKNKDFLKEYKLDGLTEFYPAHLAKKLKTKEVTTISSQMKITCYDLHSFIQSRQYLFEVNYDLYKCACPNWDNTPRKLYTGADIYCLEDIDFRNWLYNNIKWTKQNLPYDKQYTYLNAWNEWGEGAILEPTTRYGYKYLQIVKDVLESFKNENV